MKKEEKIGFYDLYHFASLHRVKWFNAKWRLAMILLAAVISFFAWQHLLAEYPQQNGGVVANLQPGMSLGERVFSWFAGGLMLGALLFAVLLEGEFFLSTRRAAKELEAEFKKVFPSGRLAKPLKRRASHKV
ncbi:MAG: hypothetical protein AB1626_01655 [Candidatus Micrarchaeota archaeon]